MVSGDFVDGTSYSDFPQTRFQGSKYRLLDWLHGHLKALSYDTVLDAFSGSGVVSYYFKTRGKAVTSNDILGSAHVAAKALVENSGVRVSDELLGRVLELPAYGDFAHFIEESYGGYYFTDAENIWLDGVTANIRDVEDGYARSILYWALFQACLIKRPYNLFHRKNLYMRLSDVRRSFGNKTTWDRAFPEYLRKFVGEANRAVFDNGRNNRALRGDVSRVEGAYDLVYIDPPYMKQRRNMSGNDYQDYYHFLDGILDYDNWGMRLDLRLKHKPYGMAKSSWIDPGKIRDEFERLFARFDDSILVVSYNTEGYPSPDELRELLGSYKGSVEILRKDIRYALKRGRNAEVLVVGR